MKEGLAQMMKGGIIMDVVNADQARIAEEAGACAVMALERVPADIRRDGGVARMADPEVIDSHKYTHYPPLSSLPRSTLRPSPSLSSASLESEGDKRRSHHPSHGKVSNRAFCGGPNPRNPQCGLH